MSIREATALIEDAHRQLRYYTNQSKADKLENLRNLFEVWDNADNETINRPLKAVISKVVLHVQEIAGRQYAYGSRSSKTKMPAVMICVGVRRDSHAPYNRIWRVTRRSNARGRSISGRLRYWFSDKFAV